MPAWHARLCRPLVLVGALVSIALLLPATGYAQVKRLDTFENDAGGIVHRWSYDGGSTWSSWADVPGPNNKSFVGVPAVVSDQPGRLYLVAKTNAGELLINRYTSATRTWQGWSVVPGTFPGQQGTWNNGNGIVYIKTGVFTYIGHSFLPDSYPALSSWGPGRLELFMNSINSENNATTLVHTWADNGVWTTKDEGWEALGTGWMQGSPAAVSNAAGRTAVFVRGGGNELVRKSFQDGWIPSTNWLPWVYQGDQGIVLPQVATVAWVP